MRARAQEQLADELARVRLGTWGAAAAGRAEAAPDIDHDPSFHEFASRVVLRDEGRMAAEHAARLQVAAQGSPAAVLRDHRLSQITIAEVDRYAPSEGPKRASVEAR